MLNGWLTRMWPRAEVIRLRRENESLSSAVRNATERAVDLQRKYEEAIGRESEALRSERDSLKAVANYAVIASGSRVAIFDGAGPTLPAPKHLTTPEPIQGRQRASTVTRLMNNDYFKAAAEQEAAWRRHLENAPVEPPIEESKVS